MRKPTLIFYILENHQPIPVEMAKWAEWMESSPSRCVALTTDGAHEVSTVFLGLNHALDDGPPLLFETMVFRCLGERPWRGLHCERCATWAEAEAMHARACAQFLPNPAPAPGSLESSAKL